jgi:dTDP-4-dehydrorhamnose 3,5-epimerase
MTFNIREQKIPEILLIKPQVYGDIRGFFMESFNSRELKKYGVDKAFVQDNHSRSGANVVRGLHFQQNNPQGKLVRVTRGAVFDVAVDVRPGSSTYGKHVSNILSEENFYQMYIPPGFAHGFCTLSEIVDFQYKVTDYWDTSDETGILWSDKGLNIDWPININDAVVSEKDKNFKPLFGENS